MWRGPMIPPRGHKMGEKLSVAAPYMVLAASQIITYQIVSEAQFFRKMARQDEKDKSGESKSKNDKNEEKWRKLVNIDRAL